MVHLSCILFAFFCLQGLTLKQHIEQTLGSGTIEQAVKLPQGEDANEWIAVNTVFLYNAVSVLYSVFDGDLCTDERCPVMSAGPQVGANYTLNCLIAVVPRTASMSCARLARCAWDCTCVNETRR
jgi:hypothetical protein